jgi:hypothetical protein
MEMELTEELDTMKEFTVLLLLDEDGQPVNAAIRARDLEGEIGWALAGKPDPWDSALVAKALRVSNGSYRILAGGSSE